MNQNLAQLPALLLPFLPPPLQAAYAFLNLSKKFLEGEVNSWQEMAAALGSLYPAGKFLLSAARIQKALKFGGESIVAETLKAECGLGNLLKAAKQLKDPSTTNVKNFQEALSKFEKLSSNLLSRPEYLRSKLMRCKEFSKLTREEQHNLIRIAMIKNLEKHEKEILWHIQKSFLSPKDKRLLTIKTKRSFERLKHKAKKTYRQRRARQNKKGGKPSMQKPSGTKGYPNRGLAHNTLYLETTSSKRDNGLIRATGEKLPGQNATSFINPSEPRRGNTREMRSFLVKGNSRNQAKESAFGIIYTEVT